MHHSDPETSHLGLCQLYLTNKGITDKDNHDSSRNSVGLDAVTLAGREERHGGLEMDRRVSHPARVFECTASRGSKIYSVMPPEFFCLGSPTAAKRPSHSL